tara:strand:+ start:321 stop:881 length:561 start_codon:yes stop_codon:yes gene_type:complete
MTYRSPREKTLKVMQFGITRPTAASDYNVGATFQYKTTIQFNNDPSVQSRYYYGNLSGLTFNTHTITDDTIVLPSGRYFIQSKIPVVEPYAHNNMTDQSHVEWKNFSSSALNGTYSEFGTRGRNNPGNLPNHAGDDAGVHTYAAGVIESDSTIYLQTRIVTNSNYTTLNTSGYWTIENRIIIWSAE